MPKRIQLRRVKGFKLPEGTLNVARPTIYGNPWVGPDAVEAYRRFISHVRSGVLSLEPIEDGLDVKRVFLKPIEQWATLRSRLFAYHKGKLDVACYCRLDDACHGDVWLDVAKWGRVSVVTKPDPRFNWSGRLDHAWFRAMGAVDEQNDDGAPLLVFKNAVGEMRLSIGYEKKNWFALIGSPEHGTEWPHPITSRGQVFHLLCALETPIAEQTKSKRA